MSDRGRSPPPPRPGGSQASHAGLSPSGSRGPSPARSAASGAAPQGYPAPLGFDPAKPVKQEERGNTRMELPPDAYLKDAGKSEFTLRGNKFNSEGKPAMIEVNQLRMTKFNFNQKIYQYDIVLSKSVDKIGPVMKKIWAHPATKNALSRYNFPTWIFDGTKIAWAPCLIDRGEVRYSLDLDEGQNRPSRDDNKFLVIIRQTTQVHFSTLQGYLDHKTDFNTSILEGMNFIDHVIRQWPSENLLAIRRNFYQPNAQGRLLQDHGVVEVRKGIYASARLSHNLARGGIGLALNVDVANTCFWVGRQPLDRLVPIFLGACDKKWLGLTPVKIGQHLRPVKAQDGQWQSSDAFKMLRKMRKLKFTVRHPNRAKIDKVFTIDDFAFDQGYGEDGGNARNVTFDYNGRQISVADYYREKYKTTLKYHDLPLINAGKKGGFIPMEFAYIEPMQRYAFKLNPDQTAAMIKIAVTRPAQRKADIQRNIADLQLPNDPYLKQYGIQFDLSFAKTEARILPPPPVNFGQGTADPKFGGRWDLRGKKFWKQNVAPLYSWAFIVMNDCVQLPALQQFARQFKTTFLGHGGKCTQDALLLNVPGDVKNDVANSLLWAHKQLTQQRGYTQLIFVVVQHRNSPHYERLKKSADCRFGILTQVVNGAAVINNSSQYHSNVCMKVNAKLGGATSRTMPPWKSSPTYFPKDRPTMMVGVDVSHAAPGGNMPSVAAMTMSVDRDATRYAAMVETNGYREEILKPGNVHFLFGQLVKQWMVGHENQYPRHVIYFRDGVSEGQFAKVLDEEVAQMKTCLQLMAPKMPLPKFTVLIATKRHHIRFFPEKGDKNGNPLPGTLVEKEVTHPFMWDFYLCSHVAIQGTARPVHYHVILDELHVPVNELQKMIYHQCYSYARSTTPVSLHPAVYYAHLAGARARAHENVATSEGFRHGGKGHELIRDREAKGRPLDMPAPGQDAPQLLTLGGKPDPNGSVEGEMRQRNFFRSTMWFI